ncbi:ABC transporter permease [Rhizobium alvei]|uniref:ABC transporter permease n=1 Tax=Rhizobium alvei TaxID=1132659 RepID=A0ABT8YTR1_9HYPH|nr:ABC transporter permease [Rhizobium alvei]MDO6966743.1 ABC transporter permease [Rhizobium alvei]
MSRPSLLKSISTPFENIPKPLSVFLGLLIWAIVIGIWASLTYTGIIKEMFLPTPDKVLTTAASMAVDGTLWEHSLSSLQVVVMGFVISSILAIPVGLMMGSYRVVQSFLEPLVNFIRYLPVTSFVPLFILWIGIDLKQRVALIVFATFFQQLVMFADAARSVPRDLVNAAYTLGTRRTETVFHIILPATLPQIMDILRVTMGWAWTYVVVAELVAARSGLGYISLKAMRGFQVDVIFMAIGMIGIMGLFTDTVFRLLRRFVAPWAN